jgi:hypothetical protein
MVVKKKVGLSSGGPSPRPASSGEARSAAAPEPETLELFFNTGIIFHELSLPEPLPDTISSFMFVTDGGDPAAASSGSRVRRAGPAEDPDVEISALDHLGELSNRWLPVPYQLSCFHSVQIYLAPAGRGSTRALLAIDTLEREGAGGRHLDAKLDEARPFRPLDRDETARFLDHPVTRELFRKMEKAGIDRAPFKLSALLEVLFPFLPRIRLSRVESQPPVPVSLVLDLGNSRSTAVLVEAREKDLFAIPIELRSSSNPFEISDEAFDSRITFLPSPFDPDVYPVAVGDSFVVPSLTRMGREALDRALETPHRYACTLSGPKRYLWDDALADDKWHFAVKLDEYRPIFGKVLKYIVEESGGLELRRDGPTTPADPRYAARTMMLFAIAEILSQAVAQINSASYRKFQGKEGNPRVLKHVVLTHPSGMRDEEKRVYEKLVENAVVLAFYLYNIHIGRRPNTDVEGGFSPFLFADEALAAQMVFVYQETAHTFGGSFEDFAKVYGRDGKVRIASVDIGGGTTDVMIADYGDKLGGTGTSLTIEQLFQDGVSIAGDEVCRAIVEDIVFAQLLAQIESYETRSKLIHLFAEGDAGHGAAWRTLKAKLVPYFWLPLARCYWALAEGFEIPDHSPDKHYSVDDLFSLFGLGWSSVVLSEVDQFLRETAPGFPGLRNLFFRFDRQEVERTIEGVLREPLRRYADILAQYDIDLLVLAGRTSALKCIVDLFMAEMPVAPPRIKTMNQYRVGDWYPSKWRENGRIKDPKSTVTAGATVLHLADKNQIAGFLLDQVSRATQRPIYGLYQEIEPNITRAGELFRDGPTSKPVFYTSGMMVGFRNVDSQEMDGAPLFEVRPANAAVEEALLADRVSLVFEIDKQGVISIKDVKSQRDVYSFSPADFELKLKTVTAQRYWLDTGIFKSILRYL